MHQFTYWLEHFKELPPTKAQTIVKTITKLSDRTAAACASVTRLAECHALSSFQRTRLAIMRGHASDLTAAEKRAIALYGDYLEFREYSNYKFPETPAPLLADYCKTMQMSYSYKAVLLQELVVCDAAGISSDVLVDKMIAYYQDRIDHGQVAEKEDSVFAKAKVSVAVAKRIIMNNPVSVLVDANVITWNKRTGVISISSEFLPATEDMRNEVLSICKDRLKRYYASIKPKKSRSKKETSPDVKKIKTLLSRLEAEVQKTPDKAAKKKLLTIHDSICTELGIVIKHKTPKKDKQKRTVSELPPVYVKLSQEDDRKVGVLVQESFSVLERMGFHFTRNQLKNMLDAEWSNTELKLNYPFLKLVDDSKPISEQRQDHLGNGRYYSRVYTFDGKKYLVTSQWYAKSKPLFISWYNRLKK